MAPPSGALLPVITKVFDTDGNFLGDAQQLWIKSPLVGTLVQGNFPPRIEVTQETQETVYLGSAPVVQEPVTATGGDMRIIAFASPDGPTHFTGAALFAGGSLTASNTNYAIVTLYDVDDVTGGQTAISGAVANTKTTGAGGSGDWTTGGKLVIDIGLGYDLPAGHSIVAVWTHGGTGVAVPGGWWRVT